MSRGPGYGRAAIVAVAAVALDQITKAIVRDGISPGEQVDLAPLLVIARPIPPK